MKVSRKQLQKYFDEKLPNNNTIIQALTMHSFEVEGVDGDDGSTSMHGDTSMPDSAESSVPTDEVIRTPTESVGAESEGEEIFDISVLPNRANDCSFPSGIAKEISIILNLKLSSDWKPESKKENNRPNL